jgi:hypothetical protein
MADNVKASNVISEWGFLVLGFDNNSERFFALVQEAMKKHGWPYPVERVDVSYGFFNVTTRGYLKTKFNKLVAYVGAETIGTNQTMNSYLNWSLTIADPGMFQKAVAAAGNFSYIIFQQFNFNEINAARAFATLLHTCVQEAVDAILDDCHIDKSNINREAKGILGGLV